MATQVGIWSRTQVFLFFCSIFELSLPGWTYTTALFSVDPDPPSVDLFASYDFSSDTFPQVVTEVEAMGATEVVAVMGAGVAEVEALVGVITVVEVAEGVEVMVAEDTERALVEMTICSILCLHCITL